MYSIAVIGAGASGMMCAGRCASFGNSVTLFEKNSQVGRKLAITGKGRCNVTNDCDNNTFLENVATNPRFLYKALSFFSTQDTKNFFENNGVKLKVERGNRVFPVSDRAYDIVDCLRDYCRKNGVKFKTETVLSVSKTPDNRFELKGEKTYSFDKVVICTGGVSYPQTGSTGDGYKFAESFGISVIPPKPALVPLETNEEWVKSLMGLSLKNVTLSIVDNTSSKVLSSEMGEMLFTHFGISGPLVLSASSCMKNISPNKYSANIDLKPALDKKKLDTRLLSDFSKLQNKNYSNALSGLLPSKLIPVFIKLSGIPEDKKVNSITKAERQKIIDLLKCLPLTVKGKRPVSEAIITSGGIDVKEINPQTMESKKIPGLFFAGEIIDVDAYTGGFNLQIAFSTAVLAADGINK